MKTTPEQIVAALACIGVAFIVIAYVGVKISEWIENKLR